MKKAPRNYSQDLDRRRQGLDYMEDHLLPDVTTDDAGKIIKVSEDGAWTLGDDENTIIEANPEEQPTVDLENLKIGDTVYSVNKPTFDTIKGLRITTADGGEYRTDRPTIRFYDDAGVELAIASSGYTASCDKSYAGSLDLTNVCSIATTDAPGAYTYIFNNDINVNTYHFIKLTNDGSFAGDIAKSIKLELTANGEDFITLWEDPAITWSGTSGASRIIDIKTGAESSTILPIVTRADNGAILRVVNGIWTKELLTKGSVINAQTDAILMYCSSANFSGATPDISFDLQYHSGYKCDMARFIDVSNLRVMLLINGKLVAYNQPFNDVFEFVQTSPSDPNAPYLVKRGDISWFLALKSAYASQLTVSDIKKFDFVYFRFLSAIILDDPITT